MLKIKVPLVRYFSPVPKSKDDSDQQEIHSIWGNLNRKGWEVLEKEFRCVILAEAGAGKTYEMKERAKTSKGLHRFVFYILIEKIADGIDGAFEIGNGEDLDCWLDSQDEAWFFLDSVDEARLKDPKAFEKAIRRFSARIKEGQHRAHILISSRPYSWRSYSDRNLVEKLLPFMPQKKELPDQTENGLIKSGGNESDPTESALKVYFLNPLDEDDIRIFAEKYGAPNVDKLIYDLHRTNLLEIAGRPFDLEGILEKWNTDQILEGRLALFDHNINSLLAEIHPDRKRQQPLNLEKARRGACALAAAVILTGEAGIFIPEELQKQAGVDAESILFDWDQEDIHILLERGIFNDAIYGMVRFRHREVREFLAAKWFFWHLEKGNSRARIKSLLFREQYGERIIPPRLRPLLPWLILFDQDIRHEILTSFPEIAVEGGDAACLSFSERQKLLGDIVERIVRKEDDNSTSNSSAIALIAQRDLCEEALRLIFKHRDNDEAIFFLGRLVWLGEMAECVPALFGIAIDSVRNIYARIAATRAVMTCGTSEQKTGLWQTLITNSNPMPRLLLAEIVEEAEADNVSVQFLLKSIEKLPPLEPFKATGLRQAINGFIARLPANNTGKLESALPILVKGLNEILNRKPHIERRTCYVSKDFEWILGAATYAVERLVQSKAKQALQADAIAIMLKVPTARNSYDQDLKNSIGSLKDLVPAWPELNDTLFWRSIEEARTHHYSKYSKSLTEFWQVHYLGHYWHFDSSSFLRVLGFFQSRDLLDDKLMALSLALDIVIQQNPPNDLLLELRSAVCDNQILEDRLNALLNPPVSPDMVKYHKDEEIREREQEKENREKAQQRALWIKKLKDDPGVIRNQAGWRIGDISEDQKALVCELRNMEPQISQGSGEHWKLLIEDFGYEVASAFRDAARTHWRNFTPGLQSEGNDSSSFEYQWIFGMMGLEFEASEQKAFPDHLSVEEILNALCYATWKVSGFPPWLERVYWVRPDLVKNTVLPELIWELSNIEPGKSNHHFLQNLFYNAPWMHSALAEPILEWMKKNEVRNKDTMHYLLQILVSGGINASCLSVLARDRVGMGTEEANLSEWYAVWVDTDPETGIPAVEQWLNLQTEIEASNSAQLFISALMGGRLKSRRELGEGNFRKAKHLKALYVLTLRYVQTKDDTDYSGKGVYSPGLREEAQQARNRLLTHLSEIPGKATFVALTELIRDHPDPDLRPWMAKLAYKRAEEDGDLELWSAKQVVDFSKDQTMTPQTHRQLFDLAVLRLFDLKNWLERGNESPYKTWQKAESEAEMRNLISGWLNNQSGNRYKCAQEAELSNKQKPDILIQSSSVKSPVPMELKILDKSWTGPALCERLRNQLAGDYLREETAGCGVMVLVWQGSEAKKRWEIGNKLANIDELGNALKSYWDSISKEFPGVVAIEVIVLDLTIRDTKSKT